MLVRDESTQYTHKSTPFKYSRAKNNFVCTENYHPGEWIKPFHKTGDN